jgi:hypothetical protein
MLAQSVMADKEFRVSGFRPPRKGIIMLQNGYSYESNNEKNTDDIASFIGL